MCDNINALPYAKALNKFCLAKNICLVQFQMRSFPYFGLSDLKSDNEDIQKLIDYLTSEGYSQFIFVGHSTGAQNIMYFLVNSKEFYFEKQKIQILFCVLQAGLSDREYESSVNKDLLALVQEIQGQQQGYQFFYNGLPITKKRFLDLYVKNGDDDFFSMDLPDEFYSSLDLPTQIPLFSAISEKDQYSLSPPEELAKQFKLFQNMKEIFIIKDADHSLGSQASTNDFIGILDNLVQQFTL